MTARELAHRIRNEIIASGAPYWALHGDNPDTTADQVRAQANPLINEIIWACTDVLGDGFYPGRDQ